APPPAPAERPNESASVYRSATGFRPSASPLPAELDAADRPVSVRELLDSAALALPDTSEFTFRPYRVRFTPDYLVRPTVGYQRDNFGRGFFGGTGVALSDILGNRTIVLSAAVNGRLSEAQFLGLYVNQSRRLNWAAGYAQQPYYFVGGYGGELVPTPGGQPSDTSFRETFYYRRFVIRDLFAESYYPFSRFSRLELGVHGINISDATLALSNYYEYLGGNVIGRYQGTLDSTASNPSISVLQPSIALVHDKTLFGYVGPFAGERSRFQVQPAIGDWRFTAGLADYRRYLFVRPFTLAFRGLVFGRFGRDAEQFPIFLGSTDLIRGYTAGSVRDHECAGSFSGCAEIDRLIGSKIAVANVELRFPLTRSLVLGFLPIGFPPIEGALFYDAGLAWSEGEHPKVPREALRSWGGSIRANMLGYLILRLDYTRPLNRRYDSSYWTVSLGPTF
ncbi:MAG: BamA/TamA family outer membrane protein, partial [Gemmatimonadales bacterium]